MLDLIYARVAARRRRWFERHPEARRRLHGPVISVGNLSVGGTGKTPLVAALAEWLLSRGERPAILSRGYARANRVDGALAVSDGVQIMADLDRAGDEPLMLARAIPGAIVCVSEDRHLAGVLAERRLGATVHLLDDGFQHVQLARDFDLLVTTRGEIGAGRVLPFGRLREGRGAAARADFVVVIGADEAGARAEAWELGISAFAWATRRPGAPGALGAPGAPGAAGAPGAPGALGWPGAAGAVVAVAGIGEPAQFFAMLRHAGYQIIETMTFADHHRYSRADVAAMHTAVRRAEASAVITTEKDAVRLEPLGALPFTVVPVRLRLEIGGWDALTASVSAAIERAREAA